MYTKMDYIYLALLWRKPDEREDFLTVNNIHNVDWNEVHYPKIHRPDLAKYALFLKNEMKGVYDTREEAWNEAQTLEGYVRVVDVPITELDAPNYSRYYSEGRMIKPSEDIEL